MVDQPEFAGFECVDGLRRQDHAQCTLAPDQARQALRATEWRGEAKRNFSLAEFGALAGDCQRRSLGDLTAAAVGKAVYGNDDGLGE